MSSLANRRERNLHTSAKVNKKDENLDLPEQGPFLGIGKGHAASASSRPPYPWAREVAAPRTQPHARNDLSDTP